MKVWILAFFCCAPLFADFVNLPVSQLEQLQKGPCVFIHPWATWCAQCMKELPDLIPKFEVWKGPHVVVIDTSNPFSQENLTRKWNVLRHSRLKIYLKPGSIDAEGYRKAIAHEWDGSLPYSVLYSKGRKLREWRGALDFRRVSAEVEKACR